VGWFCALGEHLAGGREKPPTTGRGNAMDCVAELLSIRRAGLGLEGDQGLQAVTAGWDQASNCSGGWAWRAQFTCHLSQQSICFLGHLSSIGRFLFTIQKCWRFILQSVTLILLTAPLRASCRECHVYESRCLISSVIGQESRFS
jgi:hypothetical protein